MEAIIFKTLSETYFSVEKGFALIPQVASYTGSGEGDYRIADAIAMGTWPSRGLDLHGIEIKSNRADWVRELNNPRKAETIAAFCHYWWLAVSDAAIVYKGELPSLWGLIEVKGVKSKVIKRPKKQKAKPITYEFLASIMRQVGKMTTSDVALDAALTAKYQAGVEWGKERGASDLKRKIADLTWEVERLRNFKIEVQRFTDVAGIDARRLSRRMISPDFAKLIKYLVNANPPIHATHAIAQLENIHSQVEIVGKALVDLTESMRTINTGIDKEWIDALYEENECTRKSTDPESSNS